MTPQTRGRSIMEAIELAQAEMLPGDDADIVVCAGPPVCALQGDQAIAASEAGCPHYTRITVGEELPRA